MGEWVYVVVGCGHDGRQTIWRVCGTLEDGHRTGRLLVTRTGMERYYVEPVLLWDTETVDAHERAERGVQP